LLLSQLIAILVFAYAGIISAQQYYFANSEDKYSFKIKLKAYSFIICCWLEWVTGLIRIADIESVENTSIMV